MPNNIPYSRKLGPLTPFVGEWEGDAGVDRSYHNKDDWTTGTAYFEKAWFKPIPVQENGQQVLWGLHYGMTAWRHGEVMRTVVFGRGTAILAGSSAKPDDKVLTFDAKPGQAHYGVLQNKYLLERAEIRDFKSKFTVNDDGTLAYTSDLLLKLAATGEEMHHTDKNVLPRVRRYHPSAEAR